MGLSAPSTSKARGATPLSAAHTLALLLWLSAPSTSKARGASLLRQTKMLNDVLSHTANIVKPALTAALWLLFIRLRRSRPEERLQESGGVGLLPKSPVPYGG